MAKGFLSNLFAPKAESILGVDIASTSVKIVELSGRNADSVELSGYVIEPLPREAITDGNIVNVEMVAEAVRRARRKLGSRTKNAATCLPSGMVFSKKVPKPSDLSDDDLEFQIEADANQYVPFPLDEVNIDYQVLGPAKGVEGEVEVLLSAARKEKIEERVASIEASGLRAKVVDVDSYALQAAYAYLAAQLPRQGSGQNIAVFDIGAATTRLYVMHEGEMVFSRESSFGGNQLTQDIQRAFNMTSEEAEAAKIEGGLPSNYEGDVLKPYIDTLAIELSRALQFFFTSTSSQQIDHVFLGGGVSRIAGLAEAVARRTNVHTTIANPFAGMPAGKAAKGATKDAPALLTACGLAMRRFPA
jgi:type IV pilus assembly protein PilM